MTEMFRSRWMDWEKSNTPRVRGAKSDKSPSEDLKTSKVQGAKGAKSPSGTFGTLYLGHFQSSAASDIGRPAEQQHHDEINELSPTCIFCRQPVERGQPGTGALAGEDLHMACYEEDARAAAQERAAIQTEANAEPTQHEKNEDDPLREFDEWIRSEPSKPDTKSDA